MYNHTNTREVLPLSLAPCVPADVVVAALCEGNGAVVTWGHSPVATSYLLTATGRDGHVANCSTPENNCTLTALHCGQTYNLSVTAVGDNCTSQPGTSSYRAGRDSVLHRRIQIVTCRSQIFTIES